MLEKVTLKDLAVQVAKHRRGSLSHRDLVEWAREALMAPEFPAEESDLLMEALQDISASSPGDLENALRNYGKVMQALNLEPGPDPSRN